MFPTITSTKCDLHATVLSIQYLHMHTYKKTLYSTQQRGLKHMQPDLALHCLKAIVATLLCIPSAAAELLPDLDYDGRHSTMLRRLEHDDRFIRHTHPLWWFNTVVTLTLRAASVMALLNHHTGRLR